MDVPQSWRVSIPTDLALEAAVSLRRPVQLLGSQVTAGPAGRDQNGWKRLKLMDVHPPQSWACIPAIFRAGNTKKNEQMLCSETYYIYMYLFLIHAHMYPKVVCSRNLWIS